jgi:hypothetical protein
MDSWAIRALKGPDLALAAYDVWDLTQSRVPRSRLCSLEPIGLGTPFTESLTSYLRRLAEAHAVRLDVLMTEILQHLPGRRGVRTRALNGNDRAAGEIVAVLGSLTGRRDLAYLTFLPWADIFHAGPLLRTEQAWCPRCYSERTNNGEVRYEPLLWACCGVACPRHHAPLYTTCSYLKRERFPECMRWRTDTVECDGHPEEIWRSTRSQVDTWAIARLIMSAPRRPVNLPAMLTPNRSRGFRCLADILRLARSLSLNRHHGPRTITAAVIWADGRKGVLSWRRRVPPPTIPL